MKPYNYNPTTINQTIDWLKQNGINTGMCEEIVDILTQHLETDFNFLELGLHNVFYALYELLIWMRDDFEA